MCEDEGGARVLLQPLAARREARRAFPALPGHGASLASPEHRDNPEFRAHPPTAKVAAVGETP